MMDHPLVLLVAFPVAAYLIGSIPFGVIIARSRGIDLRTRGSGNIGATNVGRVVGRKWGYICFALDVAKGFVPTLALGYCVGFGRPDLLEQVAWLAVGFAAVAGHVFSVFLRFRGGKGVATSLGVVLGIFPHFTIPGAAALAVWLIVVGIWRYVSLASVAAAGAFPLLYAGSALLGLTAGHWVFLAFTVVTAALVIVRHRNNISRLRAGTENRIGSGKAKDELAGDGDSPSSGR